MKSLLSTLLLAAWSLASHAATFEVEATTPQQMAILRVTHTSARPIVTDLSMAGNRISVTLVGQAQGLPWPGCCDLFRTQLGKLPAGNYVVEVKGLDAAVPVTIPFTVAPLAGTVQPVSDNTDLWWNPAESGWGLNVVQHGSTNIFATWFVYGTDGQPLWYVIPEGQWASPIEYRGPIYRTSGPDIAGAFDPSKVSRTLVGSGILRFGLGGLTATLTVDGQTMVKSLQRQSF